MSDSSPDGVRDRLGGSSRRIGPVLAVLAGVAFWGWLLTRWFNDWVLARVGVGPGAGENYLSPAPFEAAAETFEGTVATVGPVRLPMNWLATLFDGVALAIDIAPILADGAWNTIVLTGVSIVLGLFIAVPIAVLRVYGGPFRWIALAYTELIRGTPLLAQLFVLYYGLPLAVWINDLEMVGRGFVPEYAFWIAIIGFTINGSAYQAEYIRGALESVDEGQLTAARAIGMTRLEGIRHVVLPQTLRYGIPAWTNELVYLIKYSSLAGFITVPELYYRASRVASSTFEYTPIFTLLALVYLGLVLTATDAMGRLERRVAIPGLGQVGGRQQGTSKETRTDADETA
ncbi:amino acid ABC transporter permease [Natronoglomus mannanivorans]|uniref:Amino acid ABC transporter permease n=1 Tax=Natronoglomus mannanivorans TaxID=2979990 RepID=A0AAP2YX98_9EURY|nr:amino acid ABC transporter permease [Halobacteria archaeon AArc-xg1-1]